MGISSLWSRKGPGPESNSEVSFKELTDQYDIVKIYDDIPGREFAIVTEKSHVGVEFGTTSASPWTSFTRQEYNPSLQGLRGLEVFDKMRKSDPVVRGTLRSVKTPVLSGRWFVQPYCYDGISDSEKQMHEKIARWVWCNLTELMSIGWTQVMIEGLLMLDFGYYMFEKVWENDIVEFEGEMGLYTVLKKLAPRHPMDVKEWVFDGHGGPVGAWFYSDRLDIEGDSVFIPIEKLLVFSHDREAGNIEGISILRSAYKPWYFKQQLEKIDAIQKERHGIGIPVIKLPLGYTKDDKLAAENLGRNIRTNDRAHVVLPPNWDIMMLKMEGQPVQPLESIEYHDAGIRENVLVTLIGENAREDDLVLYFKAIRVIADIYADTFNTYLIPQMVKHNFPGVNWFPKLKVRRIGETADWRTLSFAIRNLIGAGAIIPDEPLEVLLRDEMDLPAIDKASARLIATPQNPYDVNEELDPNGDPTDPYGQMNNAGVGSGQNSQDVHNNKSPAYNRKPKGRKQRGAKVGLPRQALPSNARGLSRRAGNDRSGGK